MKNHVTEGNIFDDLGLDPAEAADLKLRAELMLKIKLYAEKHELTQHELSKRLDVPQSRVSDLLKGKIGKFSLGMLIRISERLGMKVRLVVEAA